MKITKEQLKQIIKEELTEMDQSFGGSQRDPKEAQATIAFQEAAAALIAIIGFKEVERLLVRLGPTARRGWLEESKKSEKNEKNERRTRK